MRRDWAGKRPCDRISTETLAGPDFACAHGAYGTSAVLALEGYEKGEVIAPEPNTNMIYPRTVLPMLHARIRPGKTVLLCGVYGSVEDVKDFVPAYVEGRPFEGKEIQQIAEAMKNA